MRKILILFVAFAAMWCVSCSDDDDEGATVSPDGKRLVSKIRYVDISNESLYEERTFQYDKNGNIERIIEKGNDGEEWTDIYTYSRSGNKITARCDETYVEDGTIDKGSYTTIYTLNDKGFMSKSEYGDEEDNSIAVCRYSYDDEGQLIEYYSEESRDDTLKYSWSGGNLVQQGGKSISGNKYWERTLTYTKEENKTNVDFGAFFWTVGDEDYLELFGYTGKINKNYMHEDETRTCEYTFDKEGYVIEVLMEYEDDQEKYKYTIEYK